MLLALNISSMNSISLDVDRIYELAVSVYFSSCGERRALLAELRDLDSNRVLGCDLVVREPDGRIVARDFLLMPDRQWRDSVGRRNNKLSHLFPIDLESFTLSTRTAEQIREIGVNHA